MNKSEKAEIFERFVCDPIAVRDEWSIGIDRGAFKPTHTTLFRQSPDRIKSFCFFIMSIANNKVLKTHSKSLIS